MGGVAYVMNNKLLQSFNHQIKNYQYHFSFIAKFNPRQYFWLYGRHHLFQENFQKNWLFCLLRKYATSSHICPLKLTNKYHSSLARHGWSTEGSMHKHCFKMFVSVPAICLTSPSLIWERVMFHSLQRKNWEVNPQGWKQWKLHRL